MHVSSWHRNSLTSKNRTDHYPGFELTSQVWSDLNQDEWMVLNHVWYVAFVQPSSGCLVWVLQESLIHKQGQQCMLTDFVGRCSSQFCTGCINSTFGEWAWICHMVSTKWHLNVLVSSEISPCLFSHQMQLCSLAMVWQCRLPYTHLLMVVFTFSRIQQFSVLINRL